MTSSYPVSPMATIQSIAHTVPLSGSGAGVVGATPNANNRYRNANSLTAITIYQEMISQRWILATFRRETFISIEHKTNQNEN
jgi:hypothetical protein